MGHRFEVGGWQLITNLTHVFINHFQKLNHNSKFGLVRKYIVQGWGCGC